MTNLENGESVKHEDFEIVKSEDYPHDWLNRLPTSGNTTDIVRKITVRHQNLFNHKPPLGFATLLWFWEPTVQEDVWRIFKRPIKLNKDAVDYFPYMADMGFVTRSVYSVRMNPGLHALYQVIYCANGIHRGLIHLKVGILV
ncbi:hypothetical protein Phum_PHUM044530 [Pediculus humanus corporis]|uniref:Rhabdovirus nucleocapsid domain-containing protein n=1 Tax=Pediculus humanus subsp. corporis TaxID=121224 RepID=E0VAT6_PEDHC|nr:uncharacterized protein Phum_PHUM044530 [Pediculus humanus corporis]EEB10492.1 hypothetical protein Phum_PHUM044530 [Pediculus humanus corporis]